MTDSEAVHQLIGRALATLGDDTPASDKATLYTAIGNLMHLLANALSGGFAITAEANADAADAASAAITTFGTNAATVTAAFPWP